MSIVTPSSHHSTAANVTEKAQPTPVDTPSPVRAVLLPYLLGLLTAFTLTGAGIFVLRRPDPPPIQVMAPPTPAPTATAAPTPTPGPIVVYVSGAVAAPGTFTLAPNARIADAITAAGGLRADADSAQVNQAQHLFDGAQVHVPTAGAAPIPAAGLSGLLPTPTPASRAATIDVSAGGQIDLNTATQAELETLPGIGASKAAAIIANRPYATVDDLDRVPGIGPSTLAQLRSLVSVQP